MSIKYELIKYTLIKSPFIFKKGRDLFELIYEKMIFLFYLDYFYNDFFIYYLLYNLHLNIITNLPSINLYGLNYYISKGRRLPTYHLPYIAGFFILFCSSLEYTFLEDILANNMKMGDLASQMKELSAEMKELSAEMKELSAEMKELSENKPKSESSKLIKFTKKMGWLLIATGSYLCIIWILANYPDN
jgi:outer membrane murein-binding lipoprotein Lpp